MKHGPTVEIFNLVSWFLPNFYQFYMREISKDDGTNSLKKRKVTLYLDNFVF